MKRLAFALILSMSSLMTVPLTANDCETLCWSMCTNVCDHHDNITQYLNCLEGCYSGCSYGCSWGGGGHLGTRNDTP